MKQLARSIQDYILELVFSIVMGTGGYTTGVRVRKHQSSFLIKQSPYGKLEDYQRILYYNSTHRKTFRERRKRYCGREQKHITSLLDVVGCMLVGITL